MRAAMPARSPARPDRAAVPPVRTSPAHRALPHNPRFSALAVQTKLEVGATDDPLEREADRVADVVMRNDDTTVRRICAECAEEQATVRRQPAEEEPDELVQREAVLGPVGGSLAPGLAHQVQATRRGGEPLSPSVRAFFEPRFGRDLGSVRIHRDASAADAASALAARAYAIGRDIAFARGQYQPGTPAGRRLLAHEIIHTLQQTAPAEKGVTPAPLMVARRGPMPAVRPPPPRVQPRPVPQTQPRPAPGAGTAAPSGARLAEPAPYYQIYAPPEPWDTSLHAAMWRASEQEARNQAIFEGEIPHATLLRGGTAPDFVSDAGRQQAMIASGAVVTYRARRFHILNAIEHEIGRATMEEHVASVVRTYLPDSLLAHALGVERALQYRTGGLAPMILTPHWRFRLDPAIDPRAEQRLMVLAKALTQRLAAAPQLRRAPLVRSIIENLMLEVPETQQGPCYERPVPRAGGHAGHDAFATRVTGSTMDYLISTPEGISCQFDGLDPHGQLWEVKTGYRYFSEYNIIWSLEVGRFHNMVNELEGQRIRCAWVAARCGRRYAWAFDDPEVASFMQTQWGGVPPVFYIPPR